MTPDTSGPPSRTPFAYYDRETSCWRTSQGTFHSDWATFSETWPRSGMTHAGSAYALPTWAPRTGDSASSSLLPTPDAALALGGHRSRGGSRSDELLLPGIVPLFGTPRSVLRKAGDVPTTLAMVARNGYKSRLEEDVALLPTPRAQNGVERNAHPWARPLDEPQNLENALARVPTVAQQIGASTPPPSPAGKTSSDDQPPPPPNPAATDDPDWLPLSWNG